jgi:hypothetical protein
MAVADAVALDRSGQLGRQAVNERRREYRSAS